MRFIAAALCLLQSCVGVVLPTAFAAEEAATPPTVYVIPIRDDIMPPLVYIVRRGVKEAMEANADLLVLDMDTNGGRVDTTQEIISILGQFPGRTVTFVNHKAFSAGAFIAVATQEIYMAPQSVIGAAAPILAGPGGGVEMPEGMEAKLTSGIRALVRATAEKNGHNVDVVEAMIDRSKELTIDGEVLNEKGQILTLTNVQAEREYGEPPRRLFSAGTVADLDALLAATGFAGARRVVIEPTGVERLGTWINAISPILLMAGILGLYLEFKTPGFGVPGIVGIISFSLYFLGGYVAGLSGFEWVALFALGLLLFGLEIFVLPGTFFLGLAGAGMMLMAIIMAMVDIYPSVPGIPGSFNVRIPINEIIMNLAITTLGAAALLWALSRLLPRSSHYNQLVSVSASGEGSVAMQAQEQATHLGEIGTTLSTLRPGGKALFGEAVLDVISQGQMIDKGEKVRVVGYSAHEAVVEPVR
jgi:membrane-bound serine protease (ClpP class)